MSELDRLALAVLQPGFHGVRLPTAFAGLLDEGLGGICLFGSNTAGGRAETRALVAAVHAASDSAVVAVDEEGGDVTRLYVEEGSPVLGPAALGVVDSLELTESTGHAVGSDLADLGIDLCLGPVADLNTTPDNPVIGTRSFGTGPRRAADHVAAWVRGLQAAGPGACAKHFPGHGDTSDDSHLALPTVTADYRTLAARELMPFASAARAGAAAVMTSHIMVPALDPDLPATFSPVTLRLLREQLGFEGVIVSDALDMAGASAGRGIPQAAVLALVAGADLLCLGPDKDEALVRAVQTAIVDGVRHGRLDEERLADAARRASTLRRRELVGEPARVVAPSPAVRVEGRLPRLTDALLVAAESEPSIAVGPAVWGLAPDLTLDAADPGALSELKKAADGRIVVLQVRDAHRHAGVPELVREASVVIEYGWPGPAPVVPRICTFGASRPADEAVAALLRESGWDR
jgi:beta-N-acetylhexosaminidase